MLIRAAALFLGLVIACFGVLFAWDEFQYRTGWYPLFQCNPATLDESAVIKAFSVVSRLLTLPPGSHSTLVSLYREDEIDWPSFRGQVSLFRFGREEAYYITGNGCDVSFEGPLGTFYDATISTRTLKLVSHRMY